MILNCLRRNTFMALTLGVLSATQAHALGGGTLFDTVLKPVGVTETNCNFNPYYDPGGSEAQVNFASGSAGGNYWLGGSIQSWGPGDILASEIATRCNITGITNYVSDGANGTYAADDFVGVSFTGQYGGQWYDYEIGVKGASGTQLVNSRVASAPPNTTPTADAGSAQTVPSASNVTLDGSGSDANDAGQSLTYAWTQTAGTSVTLSDATAQSPSFTAPTVAIGASEMLTFQLIVNDGIEASPASTVTITVNGAANTTPTADAGSAQTVPSASNVTLDGSGSDANDAGQSLTYAWTQTAGTSVTLSDATAQSPSFTAPTVAIGASEMLTFQLIVNDGIEASPASTVTITVNGAANTTRPTVTLSGAPSYHDGNTPFMLTVVFSEAVTGFTASDVSIQNAAVTGISGSGDTYSLVITPQDQNQAVTVRVEEDGALGASGNLNEASAIISIAGSSVAMSQEEIREFMSYRAGLLVRAQPKLSRFLKPGGGSLSASATATRRKIDFSTSYDAYVWADGTALWNQEGDDHQSYTHLTFGSHFSVSEDLIIGAMVQFDWTGSESSARDIESTGYLIGPYFAARLANQPLVFTGSLLHGRTENDLTLAGRPTDRFDSTRTLATFGVEGSIAMANGMTLVPSVDLLYLRDHQHAYTNSVGAVVPEQTLEQKTAHLGLDLEIPVRLSDFDILLTPGVHARFSDTNNGGTHTSSSSFGVEFGGLVTLSERSSVSVGLFYDGIGDNASETWGGSLLYELKF